MLKEAKTKTLKILWLTVISITPVLLTSAVIFDIDLSVRSQELPYIVIFLSVVLAAFFGEYVDASIGMGFGTILTPSLIILGYDPLEAIPSMLFSEAAVGIISGIFHHKIGNTNLAKGSIERKTAFALVLLSIVGVITAASLVLVINPIYVKIYIAVMIFLIGIILSVRHNTIIKGFVPFNCCF